MTNNQLIQEITLKLQCRRELYSEQTTKEIIALVREHDGWVSVEDELPELETNVLTSTLMNDGTYSKPSLGFIFHKRGMPNQGDLVWTSGQVDRWCPLPSPPTTEKEREIMSELTYDIGRYIAQLAPHMHNRKGNVLLGCAQSELIAIEQENQALKAIIEELRLAYLELSSAEADYRYKHDINGDGHIVTGRAWDSMRKINEKHLDGLIAKTTQQSLDTLKAEIADPLQYKIDELMLEYCPDEMTMDQIANWESHQRKYQSSTNENQIGSKAEDK